MIRSLGIELTPGNPEPMYAQIIDAITGRILSGALPEGFRLPPTRRLAEELRTHRNTVVRAYEELSAVGLTTSVVGRGTFVAARPEDPARVDTPTEETGALPWAALISRAAEAEPLRRIERISRGVRPGATINLTRMQPPDELLPHEQLRRCLDHVLRTRGARALGYAPREGLPALRETITAELARSGVPAAADDITITTGSQQALDLLARALINPGEVALVDEWTYSGALKVFAAAGARLVGVPCDAEGPDLGALRRLQVEHPKLLYLMPNCGNPTGQRISTARRRALIRWSHEAGVPLIEDDYGADLSLDGEPSPPALRAMDAQVIHIGTFSKKLIPALRVGFMVAPTALRERLLPLKHAMDLGTSALLQHALAEFIDRGYLRAHLQRTQVAYRARFEALCEGLRAHLPPEIRWDPPRSGLVIWLELPRGIDPEELFRAAQEEGALVSPSTLHSPSGGTRGGVRLTFCAEPPERLREGARRLGAALRRVMSRAQGSPPARMDVV